MTSSSEVPAPPPKQGSSLCSQPMAVYEDVPATTKSVLIEVARDDGGHPFVGEDAPEDTSVRIVRNTF